MALTDNPPSPLRPTFDRERCPYIAKQLAEDVLSEAERRRRAMGQGADGAPARSSTMVKNEQPKPNLRPPLHLSRGPLAASHAAAMRADDRAARKAWFIAKRRKGDPERGSRERDQER